MKRKYFLILLSVVLLSGCTNKESEPEPEKEVLETEAEKEDQQPIIGEASGEIVEFEAEIVTEEPKALEENEESKVPKESEENEELKEITELEDAEEPIAEMQSKDLSGNEPIIAQVEYNCETKLADGVIFALVSEDAEPGGYAQNVTLQVNSEAYDLSAEGSCVYGYVMRRHDGKMFLLFCMDWASDDYHTLVVDITDGKIKLCDDYDGAYFDVISGEFEAIDIHKRMPVLGYRYGDMKCTLTAEGKLENSGEVYSISEKLTIINYELPVVIEEADTALAIGTEIQLTGTNGKNIVYFTVLETGQSGEFYLERDEENFWREPKINGIPEYEYFQTELYDGRLHYAG